MTDAARVVGAADSVDYRGRSEREAYELDVHERRIISAYCCTCEISATLLLEVGDESAWEHDEMHASHKVEYHRDE